MAEAGEQRDAPGLSDLDALKKEIMAEVESKLLESLWQKGQAEIRKLQQEEASLAAQQDAMRKELREMQAALAQVTGNVELVVHQMREVFRLMPQLSTSLAADVDCATTPQRPSDGPPGLESTKATPAAVLSLADSLPPVTTPAVAGTPLQLAEILSQQADADGPSDRHPSTPRQHGQVESLQVTLFKDAGFTTLGMDVKTIQPGMLRVDGIDSHGLVGVHNARQTTTQTQILEGDHIRDINGVREDTDLMLAECKSKQELTIILERRVIVSSPEMEAMSGTDNATPVAKQWGSQMRPDAESFVPRSPLELQDRTAALSGQHSWAGMESMDVLMHDFQSLPLHNLGNP